MDLTLNEKKVSVHRDSITECPKASTLWKNSEQQRRCSEIKNENKSNRNIDAKSGENSNLLKPIRANVRMISGCKDEQCSADVQNISIAFQLSQGNGAGGACTHALIKSMEEGPTSWLGLLSRMQRLLKEENFDQIPQLSASKNFDMTAPFEVMQPGKGNHRALLIGINYVGMQGELNGCHNDVATIKSFLLQHGYDEKPENLTVMCDDGISIKPTKENIIDGFSWLTDGARSGDSLFLHYSGHGVSVPDENGDELDGMDEALCPLDYEAAGFIVDDDIYNMLFPHLRRGVNFTILMGTIMDLPFVLNFSGAMVNAMEAGEVKQEMVMRENCNGIGLRKLDAASVETIDDYAKRLFKIYEGHYNSSRGA